MYDEEKSSNRDKMISKWLPRIAFIIGLCAFLFQITVLYPWHVELSNEFATLAKSVKKCSK